MSGAEVRELNKSFEPVDPIDFSPDFIKALRESTIASGRMSIHQGWIGQAGLVELFGLRQIGKGEIAHFYGGVGKQRVGYIADHNEGNRGWLKTNHEKLLGEINADRWVHFSPEPWIFSRTGKCKSAQHRGFAGFTRMLTDPSYKMGITLSFGLPDELADILDRQAQRRNKEIIQIHGSDLIPDSLLVDAHGELYPNASAVQTTISGEMNQMLRILYLRANGKDIKGSGEFSQKDMGEMLMRFPQAGEVLSKVYRHSLDTSGKPTAGVALWRRPLIAAMLVLSANVDNGPEIVVEGTKRKFLLPAHINAPDDEVIEGFMQVSAANTATAPFGDVYTRWAKCTNKHPQRKAGVLNGVIRQFLSNRQLEKLPAACDPATGQPLPGATEKEQWTCPQVPFDSVDPDAPKPGKDAPIYQWNSFGGLDVGYLPPVQG